MAEETLSEKAVGTPTRSLRAAANPQARMQELLQRQEPSRSESEAITLPEIDTTALPEASATALPYSSAVAHNYINQVAQTDSSKVVQEQSSAQSSASIDATDSAESQKRRRPSSQKVAPSSAKKKSSGTQRGSADPVRQAMLGMLAMPYPDDMAEGAMTVTSVKIPKPVWERLEYARTITRKDKQDIIADALRIYFELIVEDGLEQKDGSDK